MYVHITIEIVLSHLLACYSISSLQIGQNNLPVYKLSLIGSKDLPHLREIRVGEHSLSTCTLIELQQFSELHTVQFGKASAYCSHLVIEGMLVV